MCKIFADFTLISNFFRNLLEFSQFIPLSFNMFSEQFEQTYNFAEILRYSFAKTKPWIRYQKRSYAYFLNFPKFRGNFTQKFFLEI